jgi:RHS repeat-associated protein
MYTLTRKPYSHFDYHSFGMVMPGHWFSSSNYRYGFNGKERTDEISPDGSGDDYDYGKRMFDARLGRFLSLDPLAKKYPEMTPYQFASNTPIQGIDIDGLEVFYAPDGTRLGQYGKSTEVRVVNVVSQKNAIAIIDQANSGKLKYDLYETFVNTFTQDVGMNEKELNTRAFMSTIKQAENAGHDPLAYNDANGIKDGKVKTFTDKSYTEAPEDYANHPGDVNSTGSSASGAYQFLVKTWNSLTPEDQAGLKDFSPTSQDQAALFVFDYKKAMGDIEKGDIAAASKKLTARKGGEQWASLPGGSQQGITLAKAKALFKQNVAKELAGKSDIATPKGKLLKK